MLPRIVLIGLQIGIGWLAGGWIADPLIRLFGTGRDYGVLVIAVVYALIVWIVGLGGSGVLKGMKSPSAAALGVTLALALGLAVVTLIPGVREALTNILSVQVLPLLPLAGAVIGYQLLR